jgi:hypothetical protein
MVNTKQPFIYTLKHKMTGAAVSSSSTAVLAPSGHHKLIAASTYVLAGPVIGDMVTITAMGVDASVTGFSTIAGSTGQCAFNGAGGTQVLNLAYDSTVANDASVTLLAVGTTASNVSGGTTRWAIIAAYPPTSSNAGVNVTT